ncbi:response regulator [Escherichia coli]|nr:response regulator [Escherichia coli]
MTSLKTSIKTITYLSDTGCLEIQGASLHTLTLEEATDEMQSLDDMLIFGEPVTRIYPAGDMEEVDA